MALVIDESFLPATLTAAPMTDEQFAEFCADHPDLFIEMTAEGELIIMPPNFSFTSAMNQKINRQLGNWAESDGRGTVTDGTGGFTLPNGARRSPDAAWTLDTRLAALDRGQFRRYWPLCPDFVIELRFESDRLPALRRKMQEWIENGARLAWLIDPSREAVEIYRAGSDVEILENLMSVAGEGPIVGFTLELAPVWNLQRQK